MAELQQQLYVLEESAASERRELEHRLKNQVSCGRQAGACM